MCEDDTACGNNRKSPLYGRTIACLISTEFNQASSFNLRGLSPFRPVTLEKRLYKVHLNVASTHVNISQDSRFVYLVHGYDYYIQCCLASPFDRVWIMS